MTYIQSPPEFAVAWLLQSLQSHGSSRVCSHAPPESESAVNLLQSLQSCSPRVHSQSPPEFTFILLQSLHSCSSRVCSHAPPDLHLFSSRVCGHSPPEFAGLVTHTLSRVVLGKRFPPRGAPSFSFRVCSHSPPEFAGLVVHTLSRMVLGKRFPPRGATPHKAAFASPLQGCLLHSSLRHFTCGSSVVLDHRQTTLLQRWHNER